jgi:hypothetical protein
MLDLMSRMRIIIEGKMSQIIELLDEFKMIKAKMFETSDFVVIEDPDSEMMKRYNQLLGFFYPQFRTVEWISPIN